MATCNPAHSLHDTLQLKAFANPFHICKNDTSIALLFKVPPLRPCWHSVTSNPLDLPPGGQVADLPLVVMQGSLYAVISDNFETSSQEYDSQDDAMSDAEAECLLSSSSVWEGYKVRGTEAGVN